MRKEYVDRLIRLYHHMLYRNNCQLQAAVFMDFFTTVH